MTSKTRLFKELKEVRHAPLWRTALPRPLPRSLCAH